MLGTRHPHAMLLRGSKLVLLLVSCLAALSPTAQAASWCGSEGCYQVLGVKETAEPKEIRTSYYKLSRQYHPDKNKAADAQKKFQGIAKAYEILSDDRSRKRYDYALAHPEEDIQEEPYGIWKYWRTDARAVILGFLAVVSAIQYFAKQSTYDTALRKIMQSPKYHNRRAQLVAEWEAKNSKAANGSAAGYKAASLSKPARRASAKAKAKGSTLPPEAEAEIDAQCISEVGIHGSYSRPTYRDTLAFQVVMAPVWLGRWVYWQAHWQWAYRLRHQEYKPEDQAYLTYTALKWSQSIWEGLSEETRQELVDLELWVRENMAGFGREVRQGRRRLPKLVSLQSEPGDDPWAGIGDD